MNKLEINLLLYLETRAVDHDGKVNMLSMNDEDIAVAEEWNKIGYVQFGRINFKDIKVVNDRKQETHYIHLTDVAFADAAKFRRERAERTWKARDYGCATGGAAK